MICIALLVAACCQAQGRSKAFSSRWRPTRDWSHDPALFDPRESMTEKIDYIVQGCVSRRVWLLCLALAFAFFIPALMPPGPLPRIYNWICPKSPDLFVFSQPNRLPCCHLNSRRNSRLFKRSLTRPSRHHRQNRKDGRFRTHCGRCPLVFLMS